MKYYSIKEIMELTSVSRQTVYNWFDRGLKSYKIGKNIRVSENDLKEFVEKQENTK